MKTLNWTKLGRLYDPQARPRHAKLKTHAANPLAVHLEADVYRVFFSGRDQFNRSSVGAVDIDIVQRKVVAEYDEPFFEHGAPGTFHADGVSIGNCYHADGKQYMLFMGWQSPAGQHWRGDIGRLEVSPELRLKLDPDHPFMGADAEDPVSLSYPWVHQLTDGRYLMWYGSTITWDAGNNEMIHILKHASSTDGRVWQRHGLAVPYALGVAQAFSRPTVLAHPDGSFDMWFSYRSGRGEKYRIGRAFSPEGQHWNLALEQAGIDVSTEGWDMEMVAYPFVFTHGGSHYMLYNGNGYGKTGFGLAVLDDA